MLSPFCSGDGAGRESVRAAGLLGYASPAPSRVVGSAAGGDRKCWYLTHPYTGPRFAARPSAARCSLFLIIIISRYRYISSGNFV